MWTGDQSTITTLNGTGPLNLVVSGGLLHVAGVPRERFRIVATGGPSLRFHRGRLPSGPVLWAQGWSFLGQMANVAACSLHCERGVPCPLLFRGRLMSFCAQPMPGLSQAGTRPLGQILQQILALGQKEIPGKYDGGEGREIGMGWERKRRYKERFFPVLLHWSGTPPRPIPGCYLCFHRSHVL